MRFLTSCLAAALCLAPLGTPLFAQNVPHVAPLAIDGEDKRPFLAVVEFSVGKAAQEAGVGGWGVAKNLEHALYVQGKHRIANRSDISKVVKEMKFKSDDLMDDKEKTRKFGAMVGADLIVTGEVELLDKRIVIVAKMIDATKDVGEIKHSAKVAVADVSKLDSAFPLLAQFLTMSPEDFVKYGRMKMGEGRFEDAFEAFSQAEILKPSDESKALLKQAKAKLDEQRILDERAELYKRHVSEGRRLLEAQDWLSAEQSFKKALAVAGYAEDKVALDGLASAVAGIERKGRQGAARKNFENALTNVSRLFEKARTFENAPATRGEARALCNKALDELEAFLKDHRAFLSPEDLNSVNDLMGKVEKYRDSLWGGPVEGKEWSVPELGMRFVPVQPGSFKMGAPDASADDDAPAIQHPVILTKPFWIGKYEVTIADFQTYLRDSKDKSKDKEIDWDDPNCPLDKGYKLRSIGFAKSPRQPMVEISWRAANEFCKWLTAREREAKRIPDGYEYRLPTEAEWEYCCRAGTQTDYYFGVQEPLLLENAVFALNSRDMTRPVDETTPNPWGVCGMYGNAWEWCRDWYGPFSLSMETDPKGPLSSEDNLKAARGGAFTSKAPYLKSHSRTGFDYGKAEENIGFRVALGPEL